MSLVNDTNSRGPNRVPGLVGEQRIYDFLQGAVYCWCKNRSGEWFAARDLLGGKNFHWQGTPLYELFERHDGGQSDNAAVAAAGKDAGHLLRRFLMDDPREFECRKAYVNEYKWTGRWKCPITGRWRGPII